MPLYLLICHCITSLQTINSIFFSSQNYPIRSHKENVISNGFSKSSETTTTETKPKEATTTPSDGNTFKELGNKCVKSGDYAAAIEHYTKAIEINEDPIYYTNRSVCYLRLDQ